MVAKLIQGSNFAGACRYLFQAKKHTEVLWAEGVSDDAVEAAKDFSMQADLRPRLSKPMGHCILSFALQDNPSSEQISEVARTYLDLMGISNTQVLIVRHFDQPHAHAHILYNRVDNNGRTLSDKNDRYRSVKICRTLTEQYGFYIAKGKEHVRRERLRGADRAKYELYDLVSQYVPRSKSWQELGDCLARHGVSIELCRGAQGRVQGVKFVMNGLRYNGSMLDRGLSYFKIERAMAHNRAHVTTPMPLRPHTQIRPLPNILSDFRKLAWAMHGSEPENKQNSEQDEKSREIEEHLPIR